MLSPPTRRLKIHVCWNLLQMSTSGMSEGESESYGQTLASPEAQPAAMLPSYGELLLITWIPLQAYKAFMFTARILATKRHFNITKHRLRSLLSSISLQTPSHSQVEHWDGVWRRCRVRRESTGVGLRSPRQRQSASF